MIDQAACHPNLGGIALGFNGSLDGLNGASSPLPTIDVIRRRGYWLVPLALKVPTVAAAVRLASAGIPLAGVALPTSSSGREPAGWWGQAVLDTLDALAAAASNTSNPLSMAISLDACDLRPSAARLRFAVYSSALWGSQALWWEGMAACAPPASDAFALIGTVNARLAQWAGPLVLKRPLHGRRPPFSVADVFSTSSLRLPPLHGVAARAPGQAWTDIVQSMDDELIAVHLVNNSVASGRNRRLLLFLSTALQREAVGDATIHVRDDVVSSTPIEPDRFQGFADLPGDPNIDGFGPNLLGKQACSLSWTGNVMPLRMPGGSAQLVRFTLTADWPFVPPAPQPSPGAPSDLGVEEEEKLRWSRRSRRLVDRATGG